MEILSIVCINNNNNIGNDGDLLYHIKSDLRNFKSITNGHIVIMGRKTFNSLPQKKGLKGRINIVLTRNNGFSIDAENENIYISHSIEDALDICKTLYSEKKVFVIGGGEIYSEFLSKGLIDKQIITIVDDNSFGNTFYPKEYEEGYRTIFETEWINDDSEKLRYRYIVLEKINNSLK